MTYNMWMKSLRFLWSLHPDAASQRKAANGFVILSQLHGYLAAPLNQVLYAYEAFMKERVASCGCENIRVTVKGDPEQCFACHCDYCQRLSGSLGTFAAVFAEEQIESIEGEASVYSDFPKWPGTERFFCNKCGTAVHWTNPTSFPGKHIVAIGCFADKDFPGPTASFHTRYRHDWFQGFRNADNFEGTRQ